MRFLRYTFGFEFQDVKPKTIYGSLKLACPEVRDFAVNFALTCCNYKELKRHTCTAHESTYFVFIRNYRFS